MANVLFQLDIYLVVTDRGYGQNMERFARQMVCIKGITKAGQPFFSPLEATLVIIRNDNEYKQFRHNNSSDKEMLLTHRSQSYQLCYQEQYDTTSLLVKSVGAALQRMKHEVQFALITAIRHLGPASITNLVTLLSMH